MIEFQATLRWIPPTVDWDEQVHECQVFGSDAHVVRESLKQHILKIEKKSGWGCELTLTPQLKLAEKGDRP